MFVQCMPARGEVSRERGKLFCVRGAVASRSAPLEIARRTEILLLQGRSAVLSRVAALPPHRSPYRSAAADIAARWEEAQPCYLPSADVLRSTLRLPQAFFGPGLFVHPLAKSLSPTRPAAPRSRRTLLKAVPLPPATSAPAPRRGQVASVGAGNEGGVISFQ
ncbi:hypothetical protein HPB48_018894 [Haemaphysalis longicornis]|uniref:Uncharacterized protein n=1 Tax=Haemaphysalis longicornis TaxID=44386 RepID=A0A9J6G302_HAELO|nr:hypothetical protein HPB48_018894 [Haemaphysalis longicornis]